METAKNSTVLCSKLKFTTLNINIYENGEMNKTDFGEEKVHQNDNALEKQ